jgi:hypothetical protein
VGEVVFTDTFESGDSKYRYGQAYFDLVSHWGDVFPFDLSDTGGAFVCGLLLSQLGSGLPRP